ncbi:hypothetical protein VNO77_08435 [Canavalia gladiata]|uniref:Uncharacterized protein n=1 Tax=Canavalia gladiata TaxID=3824 RepID=A0AAN9M9B8_CANGL
MKKTERGTEVINHLTPENGTIVSARGLNCLSRYNAKRPSLRHVVVYVHSVPLTIQAIKRNATTGALSIIIFALFKASMTMKKTERGTEVINHLTPENGTIVSARGLNCLSRYNAKRPSLRHVVVYVHSVPLTIQAIKRNATTGALSIIIFALAESETCCCLCSFCTLNHPSHQKERYYWGSQYYYVCSGIPVPLLCLETVSQSRNHGKLVTHRLRLCGARGLNCLSRYNAKRPSLRHVVVYVHSVPLTIQAIKRNATTGALSIIIFALFKARMTMKKTERGTELINHLTPENGTIVSARGLNCLSRYNAKRPSLRHVVVYVHSVPLTIQAIKRNATTGALSIIIFALVKLSSLHIKGRELGWGIFGFFPRQYKEARDSAPGDLRWRSFSGLEKGQASPGFKRVSWKCCTYSRCTAMRSYTFYLCNEINRAQGARGINCLNRYNAKRPSLRHVVVYVHSAPSTIQAIKRNATTGALSIIIFALKKNILEFQWCGDTNLRSCSLRGARSCHTIIWVRYGPTHGCG